MAARNRHVAQVWANRHSDETHTGPSKRPIEVAFDAAGSPRFPSFLLTLEQARKLRDELQRWIDAAEGA